MKKIRLLALAIASLSVCSVVSANNIAENFSTDPFQNGWKTFGDAALFEWNSTNQNLEVTWDSTKSNSYFYHPLGTILATNDDFTIAFDLQLNDAVASNYGAPLAIGLFHWQDATNASFSRGGGNAPNLFEFNFFPDTGFGDSIDATLKDSQPGFGGLSFIYDDLPLNSGITYQVTLHHAAGSTNITCQVLTNGVLYTALPNVYAGSITDFRLDTMSVSSFQDDGAGDSILAHGAVDNFVVTLPPPPIQNLVGILSNGDWQIQFTGRTNWIYTLERTTNFQSWTGASAPTPGVDGTMILSDTNAPTEKAFYRVRASRP
jgi:hypothetical protein